MKNNKFRMWDKVHKEMINWEVYKHELVAEDFCDKDLIIMQFTGLKDREGTDIYEGDIVEFAVYNGNDVKFRKYKIVWLKDESAFRGVGIDNKLSIISLNNADKGLRIIGNIYENPELLEGE